MINKKANKKIKYHSHAYGIVELLKIALEQDPEFQQLTKEIADRRRLKDEY